MSDLPCSAQAADRFIFSKSLQRTTANISKTIYVRLDATCADIALTTTDKNLRPSFDPRRLKLRRLTESGEIVSFEADTASDEDLAWIDCRRPEDNWAAFTCIFADGSVDKIYVRLEGSRHDAHCGDVMAAIWPVLREDCLRDLAGNAEEAVTGALLWTISKKSDSAVLVLDGNGRLMRCNESGREMLSKGGLLRESNGFLRCPTDAATRAFYGALRTCAEMENGKKKDMILFIERRGGTGGRLPISLTKYDCPEAQGPLIVAILPRQPDSKRIEMLAQKMGLSPAEARVAALMQLGLPNREAAQIAGVKEQTFNTYAKRVLSKLDVGCRAEMAQMLTWQASLGRAS